MDSAAVQSFTILATRGRSFALFLLCLWKFGVAQRDSPWTDLTTQSHATHVTSVGPKGNAVEVRGSPLRYFELWWQESGHSPICTSIYLQMLIINSITLNCTATQIPSINNIHN